MLFARPYDRERAVTYARRWALDRNPLFFDFGGVGGNCTNFVSQCLFAGTCTMNFTRDTGWYYLSPDNRTPSWTGVSFFFDFITSNRGVGPFGREVRRREVRPGDVVQLARNEGGYYHSLLVLSRVGNDFSVAAQTEDAFGRLLSTYDFDYLRYLHIEGVRIALPDTDVCFSALLAGEAVLPQNESTPPCICVKTPEGTGGVVPQTPPREEPPAAPPPQNQAQGNQAPPIPIVPPTPEEIADAAAIPFDGVEKVAPAEKKSGFFLHRRG